MGTKVTSKEVWALIHEMEEIVMNDTGVSDYNLRWDLSKNLTAIGPLSAELDVEETDLDTVVHNILAPAEDLNREGKRDLLVNLYKLIEQGNQSFSGDYIDSILQDVLQEITPWYYSSRDNESEINELFIKVKNLVDFRL